MMPIYATLSALLLLVMPISIQGQQSRQGGDRAQQFEPYANFALQLQDPPAQNLQMAANAPVAARTCPTRDRVYLPDMQSFLIKTPLTYQEAIQACIACGSELVLVDGTNIDRFQQAFSSLGLYGDQTFWIKSWFGESTRSANECPAALVNPLMGNRLEPVQANCATRYFALCY